MIRKIRDNTLYWLLFFTGIIVSVLVFIVNPFHLEIGANKAVSVALLMVAWWVTETLPMPAVALLPLVLHPLLGISTIQDTAKAYSNPVVFLFMGGFMLGLAIQKWNLHKRIALKIVSFTGTSGDRIILGFVIATGFISMWISNTATTMMMFPIALSVIAVLKEHDQPGAGLRNFSLVLMLVIAYASNIGGMATIIGTPPNVALVAFIEKKYGYSVQFLDWILLCMPVTLLLLAMLYFILTKVVFRNNIKKSIQAEAYILSELNSLGKLSNAEKRVLIIFASTALLWITRDFINQLNFLRLDDNMIAILGALALFATPDKTCREGKTGMILEWKDTSKMAWGILLLFGGGIALANSLEKAGVMQLIGNWLAGYTQAGVFGLILLIVTISIFLSELMSNVAQVIVFAPVLAALADNLHYDPLLLAMPMTLAASAASMMPMGTPPNAIVFGSGLIGMKDMFKAGFVMNIISIIIITLFCYYVMPLVM